MIRWHNDPAPDCPRWRAEIDGETVAYAAKTGSHLDDYPWDWYLEDIEPVSGRRKSGVSDTLRAAKSEVAYSLGIGGL